MLVGREPERSHAAANAHTTAVSTSSLDAHRAVLHADFAPGVVAQHSVQRVRRSAALSRHFRCVSRGFARLVQLNPKSHFPLEKYLPHGVALCGDWRGEIGERGEGMLRHIAEGLFSLHARDMPRVFGVRRRLRC